MLLLLFKGQLLEEREGDEPEIQQKVDSAKLAILQAKFTKRSQFGGPCPDPIFSGRQEFFKEFIINSTYAFIMHLKELLGKHILQKNGSTDQPKLGKTTVECKILAKFLGLIETLPYQKYQENSTLAHEMFQERKSHQPTINILSCLHQSKINQKLVLTLPWVVEYCSMLDSVIVKMDYNQRLFKELIVIYKHHLVQASIPSFNKLFLCVHLGWLFERQSFPRELFIEELASEIEVRLDESKSETSLDDIESLSPYLLYQCCPFVSELKVILEQFNTGFKAKRGSIIAEPNKTKEITKKKTTSSDEMAVQKDLQEVLVDNFFHNQSASVKQAVDNVIERIISNFVRQLQKEIQNDCKIVLQEITANLKVLLCPNLENPEEMKAQLLSQVQCMTKKSHLNNHRKGKDIIEEQLAQKVQPSLHLLLPDDTKDTVVKFCYKIIEKRIRQDANDWMKKNWPIEYFAAHFSREFEKLWNEYTKILTTVTATIKQSGMVNVTKKELLGEDVLPVCQILIQLKSQTCKLNLGTKEGQDVSSILEFLDKIQTSFALECLEVSVEDKAILDGNIKGLEHLTFDWILSLSNFFAQFLTF